MPAITYKLKNRENWLGSHDCPYQKQKTNHSKSSLKHVRKGFKGFSFLILLLILVFLYLPGLSKYLRLRHQEERLNQDIAELTSKVEELKKEEHLIKTDVTYLEQVMRKELGLVKPGESVYKLMPEEIKSEKPASDAQVSDSAKEKGTPSN